MDSGVLYKYQIKKVNYYQYINKLYIACVPMYVLVRM